MPQKGTTSSSTSSTDGGGRLEVGFVARSHGLKGEVVVELVTNRRERVAPGSRLFAPGGRTLEVTAANPLPTAGRDRWLVTFAGVRSRESADALRGATLLAEPIDDPDALWVHELVGASVTDQDGADLGRIVAVEANPASDLLVLESGALVPLRFVTAQGEGAVTVDIPPGLLDL